MDSFDINEIENCLINCRKPIENYIDIDKTKYKDFDKNKKMGIYIFWYCNKNREIQDLCRKLIINGPAKEEQPIEWNWNINDDYICLYVGKTRDFQKRISEHLLLKTAKLYSTSDNHLIKKTTTCQLRSGFDYLYSKETQVNIKSELKKHLLLSLFPEDNFAKRFYIENYLIGLLKPWFNVDSER